MTDHIHSQKIALEDRSEAGDRMFSPSSARNRDPIREVFLSEMPLSGVILEIASGTGEHVVHLAAAAPDAHFLPGDPDIASRASIEAWTHHLHLPNIAPPHGVDVAAEDWESAFSPVDGVMCFNMIHISPFEAATGLIRGAGKILKPGGRLFLYGPYSRNGVHTAPSNAAFDESLKKRDPRWGVRDLDRDIFPLTEKAGLAFDKAIPMPANNFSVLFTRKS